jgi:hypothetical protein
MNKAALTKPAIGVLVGASLALAASAGASQTSGNWFSSMFSTGGSSATTGVSASMAAVDAAMNQKMQDDLKNCDDVGIGASIKTSIGAHSEMASATPNVESLFDVNDSCFASVSQIIDLSFSIPSLGMANSAVGGSLSTLDPQLGSAYKPASAATGYSVSRSAWTRPAASHATSRPTAARRSNRRRAACPARPRSRRWRPPRQA